MFSYCIGTPVFLEDGKLEVFLESLWIGIDIFPTPLLLSNITLGEKTEFFLYHHKTENSEYLFAFLNRDEKALFRQLLKVSGVGWKTALSILWLGTDNVIKAIELQDDALLSTVPWIGKRTAQKIIIELKNNVSLAKLDSVPLKKQTPSTQSLISLVSTLVQMGYDKARVEELITALPSDCTTLSDQTKWLIRELSK